MDRLLTRRGVMLGASAIAATPLTAEAQKTEIGSTAPAHPPAPRRMKAFLVGTKVPDLIGVSLEIFASDGIASIDVSPMMFASYAGCIESTDPAVCAFLKEVVERIKVESERTAAASGHFLSSRRSPTVSGEWIECPMCNGFTSDDGECATCLDRGCVWNNFESAVRS